MAGQALTFGEEGAGWTLPSEELHVWRASLVRPDHVIDRMRGLLSEDERERADRFRFERDRSRYIVGRGLLRELLARYLQRPPADLTFEYGEFGKPTLPSGPWFNLSHSGPLALYAFSSLGEVGVDIELDEGERAHERSIAIAERFFSASEVKALRSLPPEARPRAFLSCWTRKEAFIKARGDGLSLSLDSFDVTLAPNSPPALLRTAWCSEEPARWGLADLSDSESGYIAAVALRGAGWRLVERHIVDNTEGAMPGQE